MNEKTAREMLEILDTGDIDYEIAYLMILEIIKKMLQRIEKIEGDQS